VLSFSSTLLYRKGRTKSAGLKSSAPAPCLGIAKALTGKGSAEIIKTIATFNEIREDGRKQKL